MPPKKKTTNTRPRDAQGKFLPKNIPKNTLPTEVPLPPSPALPPRSSVLHTPNQSTAASAQLEIPAPTTPRKQLPVPEPISPVALVLNSPTPRVTQSQNLNRHNLQLEEGTRINLFTGSVRSGPQQVLPRDPPRISIPAIPYEWHYLSGETSHWREPQLEPSSPSFPNSPSHSPSSPVDIHVGTTQYPIDHPKSPPSVGRRPKGSQYLASSGTRVEPPASEEMEPLAPGQGRPNPVHDLRQDARTPDFGRGPPQPGPDQAAVEPQAAWPYTKSDWYQDAATIQQVCSEMSLGKLAFLRHLANPALAREARDILQTQVDYASRKSYLTEARTLLHDVTETPEIFQHFLERFRQGPTYSPPKSVHRSPASALRHEPYQRPNGNSPSRRSTRTPSDLHRRDDEDRVRGRRAEPPHDSIPQQQPHPGAAPYRVSQPRYISPQRPQEPPFARDFRQEQDTRRGPPSRHYPRQDSYSGRASQPRPLAQQNHKLKPELFTYDSTITPISQFLSKVEFLSSTCGEDMVMQNLGVGIMLKPESDGAIWFESIPHYVREKMYNDISMWKEMMRERFQKDRGTMLREADALTHSFATESTLPLQTYIDSRVRLYNEAGEVDEDAQARRIVHGFDPLLRQQLTLHKDPINKLQDLKRQVAAKEHTARDEWNRQESIRKAQEERVRHLESRLNSINKPSWKDARMPNRQWTRDREPPIAISNDAARAIRDYSQRRDDKTPGNDVKRDDGDKQPWQRPGRARDNKDAPWKKPWNKDDKTPWLKDSRPSAINSDSRPTTVKAYPMAGAVLMQDPDSENYVEIPDELWDQVKELHPDYDSNPEDGDQTSATVEEEND